MPFSDEAFLDVFRAYNTELWVLILALWVVSVGIFGASMLGVRAARALIPIVLSVQWLWAGLVYHAAFFARINPAAWLFAVLFVVEAVFLLADGRLQPASSRWWRGFGWALIGYGLAYPAIVGATGFDYPRMPTFGLPCPLTLLTIGYFVASSRRTLRVSAIPILWSLIGGAGAWLFGVYADAALPVAGAVLAWHVAQGYHPEPPSSSASVPERNAQ